MIEPATLVLLLLLGGAAALDHTSVGQFMLSRPLVSGVLAGALLGDPYLGFLVGALLEGVFLADIPAGGVQLAESGPAAVAGVVGAGLLGGSGGLALGLGLATLLAWIGGHTVELQRGWNARMVAPGDPGTVPSPGRHLACIAMDAGRGLALTGLGLLGAHLLPVELAARWPLDRLPTLLLLGLPAALSAGLLLRRWAPTWARGAGVFTLGFVAAIVLAFLR